MFVSQGVTSHQPVLRLAYHWLFLVVDYWFYVGEVVYQPFISGFLVGFHPHPWSQLFIKHLLRVFHLGSIAFVIGKPWRCLKSVAEITTCWLVSLGSHHEIGPQRVQLNTMDGAMEFVVFAAAWMNGHIRWTSKQPCRSLIMASNKTEGTGYYVFHPLVP